MANDNVEISKKFLFFRFIERQDLLIRGWLHVELWFIVIICLLSPVCIAHQYAVIAWVLAYILVTFFLAITSTCKTINFYRVARKASKLISKHKNTELKRIFRKGPRYLFFIIILDCAYPLTWIISFVLKLAFLKNTNDMKFLLMDKTTI